MSERVLGAIPVVAKPTIGYTPIGTFDRRSRPDNLVYGDRSVTGKGFIDVINYKTLDIFKNHR